MIGYESGTDSMLVEGLRALHPIRPELTLFRAPEGFGEVEVGVYWVGEPMILQPGERRTLHVDMTTLEPGS